MRIVRSLRANVAPSQLFGYVDDLEAYREWMPLVHDVERSEPTSPDVADAAPAWDVELQARVGPFTRSKRLRMVRTEHVEDELAVFERRELDDRQHSAWILRAALRPVASADGGTDPATDTTELTMTLWYGGGLWSGAVLQRVLDDQVTKGSDTLLEIVDPSGGSDGSAR